MRQSSHILQLNFSIFDTWCRHIWLKLKFGFGNCTCPLLLLIAFGNIGRVHISLAGSLWPVKMTCLLYITWHFTFLEVLVDGWIDGWMVVIRWKVGSWHILMEKWVDGQLGDEWMERRGSGWVVGLPLKIQQTCCIHFPDPIIITPFLPAILLSFLPSTIPQAIIH